MLRIGLTGGIASGKTAVAEEFAALGIGIIDTDLIAREVVAPELPGLNAIVEAFGTTVLHADGTLDRAALRNRVFADAAKRKQLEAILHPLIRQRALETAASIPASQGPYQIFVVPLLIETGFAELVDRILVVDTSTTIQRQRLMARDGSSPAEVEQIIASQADREQRLNAADDVIKNDGDLSELRKTVHDIHKHYLQLATPSDA